jgi:hypothetical protein
LHYDAEMIARIFLAGLGISIGACGFSGNTGDADNDPSPSGGPLGCKFTYVDICARPLGPPIVYQRDATIDTSADAVCTHVIPQGAGQPALCVLHGPSVSIAADVTIRAIGNRPLVLVSSGAIAINGQLDVSSTSPKGGSSESLGAGGDAMPCAAFVTSPESDDNGGGGGAGASFGGFGGNGATAAESNSIASDAGKLAELDVVRAGCRGQPGGGSGGNGGGSGGNGGGGAGGAPGGAVYLAAAGDITIASTGSIAANGGGGAGGDVLAGGGGGGSGGWITMEGTAIHLFGKVTANGGGGGEGGARIGKNATSGESGENGRVDDKAARGGDSPMVPGRGGNGSAAAVSNGGDAQAPTTGPSAGSGGGGGAGVLRLIGPVDGAGLLSPAS